MAQTSTDLSAIGRLQMLAHQFAAKLGYGVARLSLPSKVDRLNLIKDIQRQRPMLLTGMEAWMLATLVDASRRVPGDLAEVGAFKGASAALIASRSRGTAFHVFDTFEGLPEPLDAERPQGDWARRGSFQSNYEDVRQYLSKWPDIRIYKGIFPLTATVELEGQKFSFVHLDVDLYEGTLDSLRWFYSRLSPGAIILSHDYTFCQGVRDAFTEFFEGRPEPVIELPTNQCMVVKLAA